MEGKLLTIEDIAQAANVAKSTVSRVLNNSGYVGKETRERVEKVIAESNYTPWVTARNLSKQMSNTIGVVVSEITNPYFTRAFEGISEVIDKNDIHTERPLGDRVLEAKHIRGKSVKDGSFFLRKGEILGFAGLIGSGRSELMKSMIGIEKRTGGEVYVGGKPVMLNGISDALKVGVALVPEDRKKEGLVLKNSVGFNLTLAVLGEFIRGIHVDRSKEEKIIDQYVDAMSIKASSSRQRVGNLSGGNQQKVLIGKWLASHPQILILDEPTRGVDVGAKAEIYAIINALSEQGVSIIMISSELPEIIGMCDRIYVMSGGRVTGELNRGAFSQETIMNYATGGK